MTSVAVMGDVNVEAVSRIDTPFTELTTNRLAYEKIDLVPGGTGANFALAATSLFDEVMLLGSVGDDLLGQHIEAALCQSGVDVRLLHAAGADTGFAVAIRDGAGTAGVRLLLVRSTSANTALDPKFVDRHVSMITRADFLVTDGYSMVAEPRRTATLLAMQLAAEAGGAVVFDLVPHDLYRTTTLAMLDCSLANVGILIAEAGTIGTFLGVTRPTGIIELPHATEVLALASARYQDMAFMLRFGVGNADQSLIARPGRAPVHTYTGYRQTDSRHGFGDRLAVTELAEYFAE